MKRKLLLFPLCAALGVLVLSSYSTGPFGSGGQNRTGAGGSTANCSGSGCHPANSTNTNVTITVTNSGGNPVASWVPGNTYTVRISGTNSAGKAAFGFQSTIVQASSTSTQVGTFAASSPVVVRTGSTPDIVEQSNRIPGSVSGGTATYTAVYTWVAPATSGAGTARIYATLNAVNADNNITGDEPAAATPLDLPEGSGTSVPGVSVQALKVYPNPATSGLWLQLPDAVTQGSYLIRDIRGAAVSGGVLRIDQHQAEINVAALAAGAYFVQVQAAGGTMVSPFVKQ